MNLQDPSTRLAGLLAPVFALRHARDLGIGDTLAVRETIDFCAEHGFAVLQMLPIHETVGDHSPYNPITSRGLSPAYIWLDPASVPGLSPELLEQFAPEEWLQRLRTGPVKHGTVHALKLHILLAAWAAFFASEQYRGALGEEFAEFQRANAEWLRVFTLFRLLIREYEGNSSWTEWRPEHQSPASAEAWLERHPFREHLAHVREGLAFIQWVAWRQWMEVRAHADRRGVLLMGEVSYGVSRNSADAWAHPELFDREWSLGTRPLAYFDTNQDSERWGQNWGLPPFRWENHRADGFAWLRQRLAGMRQFCRICRLDHLRGYFRAYMFPWPGGPRHAEFNKLTEQEVLQRTGGRWPRFVPGDDDDPTWAKVNEQQGREIIRVLQEAAGDMYLFAEIMGDMPEYMARALEELAMPNLVFPQLERRADRSLRDPATYRRLSLVSYANHDHAPLAALYTRLLDLAQQDPASTAAIDLQNLLRFAGWNEPPPPALNDALLAGLQRALFATPCQLAVLHSSDLLGTPQRFNLPGSYGAETWHERLELPLAACAQHPVYGPRIAQAQELIEATGRISVSAATL